jgi:ATP-dependent DNA helicase RecG
MDVREYMLKTIEVMLKSVQEPRKDKVSPKVGALIIKPDRTVDTAFRGELREGDHAEFTLLERKNRNVCLDGSTLFATLEPCAPGARKHPKLSCSERIVNARIKKVYIGIEDPDPTVDRKGIKYLIDHGVDVEMFDADLQRIIRDANKQFIQEAEERAKQVKSKPKEVVLSPKEIGESNAVLEDLSPENIRSFIEKAKLSVDISSPEFNRLFAQLGLLEKQDSGSYIPTGLGLLLFGKRPQLTYPNALIRATYKTAGREGEDIQTIEGSLVRQPEKILSWYEDKIGRRIDRSHAGRETVYDYPLEAIRETATNAIVHRDYDIEGAPIYFEINDEAIIIKSPGKPVEPIKLKQIQEFNAPSLSRNPKIMYVFDQMGLVEQRGLGFQTIKELPTKYEIPLPIVSYEEPYMVFTFPRNLEAMRDVAGNGRLMELNTNELKGYDHIRSVRRITRKEYEEFLGIEKKTAERHLTKMMQSGLIARMGDARNTYYVII